MARRSTKRRPRVVGVIASRADLEQAVADAQAAGFIRTALGSSRGHCRSSGNAHYRNCAHRSSSQHEIRTKAALANFGCGNGGICSLDS